MGFYILGVLLIVVLVAVLVDTRSFFSVAAAAIFAGSIALVVIVMLSALDMTHWSERRTLEQHSLVALNTGSSTSGQFFLGTGHIDNEPVVRWTETTEWGTVVLKHAPAHKVQVKEDSALPSVVYVGGCDDSGVAFPWATDCLVTNYIFYVPEGSIYSEFTFQP